MLKDPSIKERVEIVLKHLNHSISWKGEKLGILEMRRHYTNYFRQLPEIKRYRSQLVQADEYLQIVDLINQIKIQYS